MLASMSPTLSNALSRRVRLWLAADGEESWNAVAHLWLRRQAATAWHDRRLTIVLVPSRAHGFYLHQRIVENGINLAAIHFWTPADARSNLLKLYPGLAPTPSREALQVLAALAAQEVGGSDPANRTAAAVLADPESFLRTVDQLASAGWDLAEIADAPLAAVVRQWRERLRLSGFQTVQEIDRALIGETRNQSPSLARLLVTGFDGADWAQSDLIQAVIEASEETDFVLTAPRLGWEDVEQAWIGTWEEKLGAAQPAAALLGDKNVAEAPERPQPYQPLQTALHSREKKFTGRIPPMVFHLGRNIRSEARAIFSTALQFLRQPGCSRLGIVFPGVGPLARETAALFDRAGIPCNDAFGFTQPGPFEREDWRAWFEFQQMPTLARFLALLEFVSVDAVFGSDGDPAMRGVTRQQVESALREAFKDVLLDDLTIIQECLKRSIRSRERATVAWIGALSPLPERAAWNEFIAAVTDALRRLGWEERADRIVLNARNVSFLSDTTVPRAVFLRWLEEVAVSTQKGRHAESNHRYSRVHLTNYAEAAKQNWSHLILTSLTEGVWPPQAGDAGFLSGSEVVRLNRSLRKLNVEALGEGSQGEGHVRLEEGKGLCLGPHERRQLAESLALAMLEHVSDLLALTARLGEERSSGMLLAPNEFISRLYELAAGRILNDEECERLCAASEKEADRVCAAVFPVSTGGSSASEATRRAYNARREETAAFGEYEFSLRAPIPDWTPSLSCGEWESALRTPAALWMKKYLNVKATREMDAESYFNEVKGTWTHQLLSSAGIARSKRFQPWLTPEQLLAAQESAAGKLRSETESLLRQCGRALPVWWLSLWNEARFQARELLSILKPGAEWTHFSVEYVLSKTECDFSADELPALKLDGRIDLLFAREMEKGDGTLPDDLWVVDFKTGRQAKALSASEMLRGNGVQLALYALALRQLGVAAVQASLAKPGEIMRQPMDLAAIDELRELWLELQRMQDSGIFGVHGELRSEYRRAADYPLATLPVDPDSLEEKWKRTHPAWSEVV